MNEQELNKLKKQELIDLILKNETIDNSKEFEKLKFELDEKYIELSKSQNEIILLKNKIQQLENEIQKSKDYDNFEINPKFSAGYKFLDKAGIPMNLTSIAYKTNNDIFWNAVSKNTGGLHTETFSETELKNMRQNF